jgi:GNAT superfamily N-acetyltransferase
VVIDRIRRALAKHGLAGTARRAAAVAREQIVLTEEHVWYELDLGGERPRPPLADGLALVEATAEQVALLEELPSMSAAAAGRLRRRGGRLFLVLEDETPLFACWIHGRETPAIAAPGGWLALPEGVSCLEDSVTSPAARGRGIAPAAWAVLGDRLAAESARTLVTKVEVENVPSRRAVEKAGFREIALMRLRRIARRRRVDVEGEGALAHELAARLR